MAARRILLVNVGLVGRSGTEIVTFETAAGLRSRRYDVAIFAPQQGPFAEVVRGEGFDVLADIDAVPWTPDLIQANQSFPLIEAIGTFPKVPVISICHDSTAWWSAPVDISTIRKHAAVDHATRDRIIQSFPHL